MSPQFVKAEAHPELSNEIATLSNKLISAINHQTVLDDTLAATRHELEASRALVTKLEEQITRQQEMLSGDVWVRRKTTESEKKALLARVADEKKLRLDVEKEKRKIEQELESLTADLFEEANKMVITAKEEARREQGAMQRKNDQIKAQLADTENLLKSQQEQLTELKQVLEQMTIEHEDQTTGTTPSSPTFSKFDVKYDEQHSSDGTAPSPLVGPVSPTYPTSFTHLIQPILRNDLSSYEDFMQLVKSSRKPAGSRISTGSFNGLGGALGLGIGGNISSAHPSNSSNTSLSTIGTPVSASSSPQTPNTPASTVSTGSTTLAAQLPALKETKFFKRVLAEDIEPTLRLDIAPGLSWLARRSVLNSMADGSLVVEPVSNNSTFASITKPQHYPCSLCGESRKEQQHLRSHRFRTNESDSAQRYPLCKYCLGRVRSTCDFLGFLRMVREGHWRAEDEDSEKAAWEESVRLREQMFWSRIGGGVIPVGHSAASLDLDKSPRISQEETRKPDGEQPVVEDLRPKTPLELSKLSAELPEFFNTPHDVHDQTDEIGNESEVQRVATPTPSKRESVQSTHPAENVVEVNEESILAKNATQRLSITIPAQG
jgi:Rab guanine nucleotide exchange factor SEC2